MNLNAIADRRIAAAVAADAAVAVAAGDAVAGVAAAGAGTAALAAAAVAGGRPTDAAPKVHYRSIQYDPDQRPRGCSIDEMLALNEKQGSAI